MDTYQEPLKLGFIGGSIESAIGYTHYIASQMDHHFTLVAGCFSRNKTINKKTALTWGIKEKHLYSEWKELLEKEVSFLDAIVILTPTPSHFQIILKALDLNYCVISEKALASSCEEGMDIVKKIENKKAFLAVTHNYTGYPMVRELQNMIQVGKLGKITHINIEMPQESYARLINAKQPQPQEWRLDEKKISGISLDLAAHLQHMIFFLTQENPKELVADASSFGWFDNVVDNIFSISRYASGMKVNMWYGKASIGHRNGLQIRIYGTKGSVQWLQINPEELIYNTIDGNRMIIDRSSNVLVANQVRYNRFKSGHPAGFIEAFGNLYVDIAQKLRIYKKDNNYQIKWSYNAQQANIGLKVFEAIEKSVKDNKWVKI